MKETFKRSNWALKEMIPFTLKTFTNICWYGALLLLFFKITSPGPSKLNDKSYCVMMLNFMCWLDWDKDAQLADKTISGCVYEGVSGK